MAERLSNHLSPRAKQRYLMAEEGETGLAVVEVAPSADPDELRDGIERLGGRIRSYVPRTRLMNVEIPANALCELAEASGVIHVSVAERYSI